MIKADKYYLIKDNRGDTFSFETICLCCSVSNDVITFQDIIAIKGVCSNGEWCISPTNKLNIKEVSRDEYPEYYL